jgi:hypothetical protein
MLSDICLAMCDEIKIMNVNLIDQQSKMPPFSSCRNITILILAVFGCSVSGILLAFLIIKGTNGMMSVPYVLSSCANAYFYAKYSTSILGVVLFVAVVIAIVCQLVLIALCSYLQVKKQYPSDLQSGSLGLFSSLAGLSLTVLGGYALSFCV